MACSASIFNRNYFCIVDVEALFPALDAMFSLIASGVRSLKTVSLTPVCLDGCTAVRETVYLGRLTNYF